MSPDPSREGGHAYLAAMTPEAKESIGGTQVEIRAFPFRVGRESRKMTWTPKGIISERRHPDRQPNNDLYLTEKSDPMNVSREHFLIDAQGEGYVLVDRDSTCGTIVEGKTVGGQTKGGRTELHDGDVIIVGTSNSPFVFQFRVR